MRIGPYQFNRMEVAGSLGDLGALLPIAMGLAMVNGLPLEGILFSAGMFYILAGAYYRVPIAVQPMKAIGAYSIALGIEPSVIQASGLWMAVVLFTIGFTGAIDLIIRFIPKPVVRGVQVATGTILATKGFSFIAGTTSFQQLAGGGEPFLAVQSIGPVPIGIPLGMLFGVLALIFLNSRKFPAGLVLVLGGVLCGLSLGAGESFALPPLGLHLPDLLPFGLPSAQAMGLALIILVLPQAPMTIGNAVLANADLSNQYFPEGKRRVTPRALCLSMAGANVLSVAFGGMPMCHGAGGLAAHYRFGARTAGSNLIIGLGLACVALLLGPEAETAVKLIPVSVLGVLLIFAGIQLALTILDVLTRNDMFVVFVMLFCTIAFNLAWGFALGLVLAFLLKTEKISV